MQRNCAFFVLRRINLDEFNSNINPEETKTPENGAQPQPETEQNSEAEAAPNVQNSAPQQAVGNNIPPQNPYAPQGENPPRNMTPPPYPYSAYPPPPNGYNGGRYYPPNYPQNPVQPPKKKRLSAAWTAVIITLISVMFVIIVILSFVVAKKSADLNKTKKENPFSTLETQTADEKVPDKDTKRVQITIPTSPKPVLEAKYYADEETGLLTTEGVAQKVMPSQVLIGVYNDTPYQMTSLGSGIIISSDGYILTNAHVVDEALQLKAQLNDGRQFEAKLVGIDRKQDIAVVKIEADDLVSAEIGNSDNVALGEQVAVIGAGGSLENSITFGYVSALGREIDTNYSSSGTLNCIQTDAALNPGNSGGALVNMYGQVIGISVGGLDHLVYDGIGFAIEINDVIPVAEALIANGYVPGRARLGIVFISITGDVANSYGVEEGLCVMDVDVTCDIATKGLQPYDIITKIDGKPVRDLESVMEVLDEKIAGEEVTLTVYRKTVTEEITTFEVTAKLEQKYD